MSYSRAMETPCLEKKQQKRNPKNILELRLVISGAEGRNRTDMGLLPLDFESSASTSFTTPAMGLFIPYLPVYRQGQKVITL